jgi:hypothetical protein
VTVISSQQARSAGSVQIQTGQLSRAPFVGNSPAVTLTWNATRYVTVLASYVHFFAGPFLKETAPRKDMGYFTFWIDYTF